MITSSPGARSSSSAVISRACVHEVVNSAPSPPVSLATSSVARVVNGPSPTTAAEVNAWLTYVSSSPAIPALANGMGNRSDMRGDHNGLARSAHGVEPPRRTDPPASPSAVGLLRIERLVGLRVENLVTRVFQAVVPHQELRSPLARLEQAGD